MKYITLLLFLFSILLVSCNLFSQEDINRSKLRCYNEKLTGLKEDSIFQNVLALFKDTFPSMRKDVASFGSQDIVTTSIDESVFFNKDKTACILIVLKKNDAGLMFGSARMIKGRKVKGKWRFRPSIDVRFSSSYYDKYSDNSFENLAEIARITVLTDGDVSNSGCEMDEHYWFEELKDKKDEE